MRLLIQIFSIIAFRSSLCLGIQQTAFIDSPDAAMSYFLQTRAISGDMSGLSKDEQKATCMNLLVNSVSFVRDKKNPSDFAMINDFADKITTTFDDHDINEIFLPNVRFHYRKERFADGVPAIVCIIDKSGFQYAITKGAHEDIHLLLHKPANAKKFQILGTLEPRPLISSKDEVKDLEAKYADAVQKIQGASVEYLPRNKRNRSTLSLLDDDQKFRLCSLGYLALKESEKADKLEQVIRVHVVEVRRDARILKEPASGEKSDIIHGDLVPCVFDEVKQQPLFFVLSDPSSEYSAFVVGLTPVWKKGAVLKDMSIVEDEKIFGYQLILHLKNVTALKIPTRNFHRPPFVDEDNESSPDEESKTEQ